jgi:hypothetical protein
MGKYRAPRTVPSILNIVSRLYYTGLKEKLQTRVCELRVLTARFSFSLAEILYNVMSLASGIYILNPHAKQSTANQNSHRIPPRVPAHIPSPIVSSSHTFNLHLQPPHPGNQHRIIAYGKYDKEKPGRLSAAWCFFICSVQSPDLRAQVAAYWSGSQPFSKLCRLVCPLVLALFSPLKGINLCTTIWGPTTAPWRRRIDIWDLMTPRKNPSAARVILGLQPF